MLAKVLRVSAQRLSRSPWLVGFQFSLSLKQDRDKERSLNPYSGDRTARRINISSIVVSRTVRCAGLSSPLTRPAFLFVCLLVWRGLCCLSVVLSPLAGCGGLFSVRAAEEDGGSERAGEGGYGYVQGHVSGINYRVASRDAHASVALLWEEEWSKPVDANANKFSLLFVERM